MAIITSRVGPFGGPYPIGNAAASGDGFQALLSRIGAKGARVALRHGYF